MMIYHDNKPESSLARERPFQHRRAAAGVMGTSRGLTVCSLARLPLWAGGPLERVPGAPTTTWPGGHKVAAIRL